MFRQRLIFSLFGLAALIFSGCSFKKKSSIKKHSAHHQELQEKLASLTHLPDAPFGFKLRSIVEDQINSDNIQITYQYVGKEKYRVENIVQSCIADMELLGWNCINQFLIETEMLLWFERPGNFFCQISLRNDELRITIVASKKGLQ